MDGRPVCRLCESNGRYCLIADIKTLEEWNQNMSRRKARDIKPEVECFRQ